MDAFTLAKFLHVTFAIIAVGWNASYGFWLARAARQSKDTQLFTLRSIKTMDDRVANPLYGLLLLTGLFMAYQAGYPLLTTRWIAGALALYVVALLMAFLLITPNFRKAIAALEADGPEGATYKSMMARGRTLGIIVGVVVLAIVFLMVTKPTV